MTRSPQTIPWTKVRLRLLCGALLVGVGWSRPLPAQLPTAQLTSLTPPGGRVGSSFEVRTAGADQDDATQLVFSHPGIKATVRMTAATEFENARPQAGVFDVQIGGDVPPGVYAARVVGRFGVSNPRAFVVGIYNEARDPGGNNQLTKAAPIGMDTSINGAVDANQVDYYKLKLAAGQRAILDCQAQRIDSRLDGSLVIYNASGKEIARARNTLGNDPLLDFTAPAEGEYAVALYDFTYRGGADYYYRLTVHSGAHIDFAYPPAGLPGSNDSYTIYGRNLPGGQPSDLMVNGSPLQQLQIQIALPADESLQRDLEIPGFVSGASAALDGIAYRLGNSNATIIGFARGPVVRETEPNSQLSQAQSVTFPCEIVGQFFPAEDVDCFAFQAKKGEIYDIELLSHRLGLPTDPILIVQKVKKNDKGDEVVQEIATVDDPGDRAGRIGSDVDTSTDDPDYRLTADEDATYRVMIRDQFGDSRDDPRMIYRLAIHRGTPDYRLVAVEQPLLAPVNANLVPLGGLAVRKGGETLLEVRVQPQYGFAGELELSVEGLPAGVRCPNVLLGPNVRTGALIFSAAEDAKAWAGNIRVVGKAKVGDRELVRYARTGIAVWGAANRQTERVVSRLSRDLAFSVIDREMQPASVQVAEDKIWETARGGKLEIPIRVVRRGDFKDDLTLAPNNAPNELKPPNLVVKGAEGEGKLQVAASNGNLKPGLYTFYLRADAKMKHQRNPDAVAAAEQEKKAFEALLAKLAEQNKQAAELKSSAPKLVEEAMQGVKQAEQAKAAAESAVKRAAENLQVVGNALVATKDAAAKDAGNNALADAARIVAQAKEAAEAAAQAAEQAVAVAQKKIEQAQAAVKSAQEQIPVREKAAADAAAKLKAAEQLKASIDKRVADATNANKPKDLQFAVVSTPVKVRIVESCLAVAADVPNPAVKQNAKLELPVRVNRLYGFEDPVELSLDVPANAKGVTAGKLTLAKGQSEGKIEISAAKDAAVGDFQLTVRAKARFNNIDSQATRTVTLKVDAAAQ